MEVHELEGALGQACHEVCSKRQSCMTTLPACVQGTKLKESVTVEVEQNAPVPEGRPDVKHFAAHVSTQRYHGHNAFYAALMQCMQDAELNSRAGQAF